MARRMNSWIDSLRWSPEGLVPAIVQDSATGEVLMMAWMNREALERTYATGQTHFYSRSRRALWHKGATSGSLFHVQDIRVDCDGDALLLQINPAGPACHTGERTCFFRALAGAQP